ncbi:MAG: hypothetical protein IPK50_09455 [Fibrobacterota bacterium]|nr:MAG: hypothetical protein IPK50_09455 [Fibrobacterota bacterium]
MIQLLRSSTIDHVQIPKKIRNQIVQGFDSTSDAHTFRFLRKRALIAPKSTLPDLTGLECYVNEIGLNIDDHIHHTLLGMEILIAVLNDWKRLDQRLVMRAILSVSSEFTHLTFHVVRPKEPYLDDNIDSYDQPIMFCDSDSSIHNLADLKNTALAPL